MDSLYLWDIPHEQSSLRAAIQQSSVGFAPFINSDNEQTIISRFASIVARHPGRPALKGRARSYTYSELDRVSNAIAAVALTESQGRRTTVALFLEHDVQMVACILGIVKAGSAYVPLDPSLTGTRNSVILDDSLAILVFTDQANHRAAKAMFGDACRILDIDEVIEADGQVGPYSARPEDPACVIYTSGSTGRPRGVLHTHQTIVQVAKRYVNSKAMGPNDRVSLLPSCSVAASIGNIFGPLLSGATLFPFNFRVEGFSALANWLVEEEISVYHSSPSVFRATFESLPPDAVLPHIRIVRTGGDVAYKTDFELFKLRVGNDSVMVNNYGCSEISTVCCFYMKPGSVITEPILPVGCPIDDTEVVILDDSGEPAPPGVTGEIAIRSPHISPGYWNKNGWGRGDQDYRGANRAYRTGDRGMVSAGYLVHMGRQDSQVKIRGHRVELAEVESNIRSHPMVKEAVVVRKKLTDQDSCLVAYLVRQPESDLTIDTLSAFVAAHLPQYMLPARYILKEKLPQTEVGKVDRMAIADWLLPEIPHTEYVAPQTHSEQKLAAIWAEVLKVARIGRHDNFFQLGGQSLLAIRVIARLRQALGVEVAISDLFAHPVLADLANYLESAEQSKLPAITRAERGERMPLSFAQQRLWFLAQLEGVSEAYHMGDRLRLRGGLQVATLRRALDRIVERHEALRTTFVMVDGEPAQRIAPVGESRFHLVEQDLRKRHDVENELDRLIVQESREAFDLETGPLIRGRLIRHGKDEHTLLLTMHHIVSDGWSMGVLIRELNALYAAFERGEDDPLPELTVQYADYAVWQRKWMEGEKLQRQAEYWRQALAGAPELLELPADRPRPARQSFAGASVELVLDEKLTEGLKELSRRYGTTLYMTLLSGWAALLARLSGQKDVMIGTPVANRGRMEIENLIGFFVNTLALRVDVSGAPTVGELLERVKERVIGAQQHQDLPFERVVEIVQPARSLAHSPLFQVAFAWQNAWEGTLELAGSEVKPLEVASHGVAKFDLMLCLQEEGVAIKGGLEYATALFEQSTIVRYSGYFRTLLQAMVADPTHAVEQLPVMPEAERRQVMYEWNATHREYEREKCVHELFEEQAERAPEAVAAVFEDEVLSYGELNRRANQLAHYLRGLGVGPDARVGICLERSLEMVVGLLAMLKAGGAYVPLDAGYPAERLGQMIADARMPVIVTHERLLERVSAEGAHEVCLDRDSEAIARASEENLVSGVSPENLAYVIYTSGSTGRPKGAGVFHRGFVNLLSWYLNEFVLSASDRVLLVSSFSFDLTQKNIFAPLIAGGRLYLSAPGYYDAAAIRQEIYEREITLLNCTPSAFYPLINGADQNAHFQLASLRRLFLGGEPISLRNLSSWLASPHFRAEIVNTYGPTECTDVSAFHRLNRAMASSSSSAPIGKPILNTRLAIVARNLNLLPIGVVGELCVMGDGAGAGYLNDPALTAAKFLPDPFSDEPGGRLYKTGDLARYLPDGNIEFLGRVDHQVKVRGFRIELEEIETALEQHPAVGRAAVVTKEFTPEDIRLIAYLAPDETRARTVRQLLRFEREGRLNGHHRYELPNGLMIMHKNKSETDFVYREIFEEEVYLKHGIALGEGACVFDVGANIGLFMIFMNRRFRNPTIYAFEPIPPIFDTLSLNAELHSVDAKLFKLGLAGEARSEVFTYFPHVSIISGRHTDIVKEKETVKTFLLNQQSSGAEARELSDAMINELLADRLHREQFICKVKTLSEVIREQGVEQIDLLKIDVEKSEFDVLAGISEEDWPKIRQVIIEVHDNDGRLSLIRSLLELHGFSLAIEQDTTLKDTGLYNVYAVREAEAHILADGDCKPSYEAARVWSNPEALIRDVRQWLLDKLPEYMTPSAFALLEELPLTPNGKLDRKRLPAPERDVYAVAGYEAPVGEIETALAEIWGKTLRLDQVGRRDNFFELGGHSLIAASMISRVRSEIGIEMPFRSIFEAPTLEAFADRIHIIDSLLEQSNELSDIVWDDSLYEEGVI
jgi:amino acid adenylation domain-containing protein/FkbM family methyltransferase